MIYWGRFHDSIILLNKIVAAHDSRRIKNYLEIACLAIAKRIRQALTYTHEESVIHTICLCVSCRSIQIENSYNSRAFLPRTMVTFCLFFLVNILKKQTDSVTTRRYVSEMLFQIFSQWNTRYNILNSIAMSPIIQML